MTKSELEEYYKNLLIIQYRNKPKASDHIKLLSGLYSLDFLPQAVKDAFDIDSAVGYQLDIIGKYAGVSRSGQGITGYINLEDDDYRKLITLAIIKNNSDATLYQIENLLFDFFGEDILLFDYKKMRMSYFLNENVGTNLLAQLVVVNDVLPLPMGILRSATVFAPNIDSFYGFVTYENPVAYNNSPMNTYEDYQLTYPWLQYQDAVEEGAILLIIENEDDSGFVLQEDDSLLYF